MRDFFLPRGSFLMLSMVWLWAAWGPTLVLADEPEFRPGGSSEVLYSFPSRTDSLSVGRNGENTFALEIPTFPAYLKPTLMANYHSRGKDSVMGVGWEIGPASISLDFSDHAYALETRPDDPRFIVRSGLDTYIKGRWVANPGGELVCEQRKAGATAWTDFDCFRDPRGQLRYTPEGTQYAESWRVVDPHEGVTQVFGDSAATRIENADGRPVAWLLHTETSRHGKEIEHFYEEAPGSDERLRVAVRMGGDKVIRFVYAKRTTAITSNYRLTVRRQTVSLLQEIQYLTECQPNQRVGTQGIWTDFSSCKNPPIERIKLTYANPETRFTGRYVLASWQHMSGDEKVSYRAARFDYTGDNMPLRSNGEAVMPVTPATPDFEIPDGYTTFTSMGHAPFQSYTDWNRDGLADWVTTKADDTRPWPDWRGTDHRIYVHRRNDQHGFDPPRQGYEEPLARYSAWLYDERLESSGTNNLFVLEAPIDNNLTSNSNVTDPADVTQTIRRDWGTEANIGISVHPFLFDDREVDQGSTPIFESLSMTVPCEDLGRPLCDSIQDTYLQVWFGETEDEEIPVSANGFEYSLRVSSLPHVYMGVKITDLRDFDGDGYLDRAVSGLLVVWDPGAPDADPLTGMRDPLNGEPCIYVSLFDPETDDFAPFERYSVATPQGDFGDLGTPFLSALAIDVQHNQRPGVGQMSGHAGIAAVDAVTSSFRAAKGLSEYFADVTAASQPFDGSMALDTALGVSGIGLSLVNAAAQMTQMPPEVRHGLALFDMASQFGSAVRAAPLVGAAGKAEQLAGWGTFLNAGRAAVDTAVMESWNSSIERKMADPGYVSSVVVNKARTHQAIYRATSAAAFVPVAILVFNSNPVTAVFGAALVIGVAIHDITRPDGSVWHADGETTYDIRNQRGLEWRKGLEAFYSSTDQVLDWVDMTGDGRLDLMVVRHQHGSSDWAIAASPTVEGAAAWESEPWRAWSFADGDGTASMASTTTRTKYEFQTVHRGDQTDVNVSMIDINGDGRLDLVDAAGRPAEYGLRVYLNTGRGFAPSVTWKADAAGGPSFCQGPIRVSRSRSLTWQEYVGPKEGYALALENTYQVLGPDIDGNGLPDLILKDEQSYPEVQASNNPCILAAGNGMCDAAMPADPEPDRPGSSACNQGKDVWYSWFDDHFGDQRGTGEGDSQLTPAAHEIFSPVTPADTYVAFNTGNGFTPYVKLNYQLPSLAGRIRAVSLTEEATALPSLAISGTTNFMADPDATGRKQLLALDIDDSGFTDLAGDHAIAHRFHIGIENPDALTSIRYPEGGTAHFGYKIQKDVQGPQGPPFWVLDRVVFDDKIRNHFPHAGEWAGTLPFVEYAYAGAKTEGRDYRGFEVMAETRFTGTDLVQVIEVFEQDGAARGSTLCREVRGTAVRDGQAVVLQGALEHPTCGGSAPNWTPTATLKSESRNLGFPDVWLPDDPADVPSCYAGIDKLGIRDLALQVRKTFDYDTGQTVMYTQPNWQHAEVLRAVERRKTTTQTYNGSPQAEEKVETVFYDRVPYLTPRKVILDVDGIQRVRETDWLHHSGDWAFLKEEERRIDTAGNTVWSRTQVYDASAPFNLLEVHEDAGSDRRSRIFNRYDSGGLATSITEGGLTSEYTYRDDFENGTGLLANVFQPRDGFQSADGNHTWVYDAMGRLLSETTPAGYVSTTSYDGLGLPETERKAGWAERTYTYHHIGFPGFARDPVSLGQAQRTEWRETTDGQTRTYVRWWDGFLREFRRGWKSDGDRTVAMDLDGDGSAETTQTFTYDREWLAERQAQVVLSDDRLNAVGEAQCTSLPYLDNQQPEAYSTTLNGPLRRQILAMDFSGFLTRGRFAVDSQKQVVTETMNGLGHTVSRVYDGRGNLVHEDISGLVSTTYEYDDWYGPLRITDKRGLSQIRVLNGWGDPLEICHQEDLAVGSPSNSCPVSWPTWKRTYDDLGQVESITDPNHHVTKITMSTCRQPGRIEYPSTSSTDPTLTSQVVHTYDADCRQVGTTERNGSETVHTFDAAGRLTSLTRASGQPEQATYEWGYDDFGRTLFAADGRGYRHYEIYDFRDQLIHTYAPEGVVTSTEYSLYGDPESRIDAEGHVTTADYDRMGRVQRLAYSSEICDIDALETGVWATQAANLEETFDYDDRGRILRRVRSDGSAEEYEYDALNRFVKIFPPDPDHAGIVDRSIFTQYLYDDSGHPERVIEPGGRMTDSTYDGLGRLRSTKIWDGVDPAVSIQTAFDYDSAGNLIRTLPPNHFATYDGGSCTDGATSANAHATERTYSPMNQVETVTQAADQAGQRHQELYTYDRAGYLATYTSPRGFTTSYEHDDLDRITRETAPDGTWKGWGYDKGGYLVAETDARGLVTRRTFDGLGRMIRLEPPHGSPTVRGYDKNSAPLFSATRVDDSTSRWEAMHHTYTPDGLPESTSRATFTGTEPTYSQLNVLATSQVCHDAGWRPIGGVDGEGRIHQRRFDLRGRLTKNRLAPVYSGGWEEIEFFYDVDDNPTRVEAAMGGNGPPLVTTDYEWDWAHRLQRETMSNAAHPTVFTYDDSGRLCQLGNDSGNGLSRSIDLTYDARGLITARKLSNGVEESFTYDKGGNLTAVTDPSGSWRRTYDNRDRVETQTQHVARLGQSFTTGFKWNATGQLEQLDYPRIQGFAAGPKTLTQAWDASSSRVTKVSSDVGSVASTLRYDGRNRLLGYTLGNGAVRDRTFHPSGLLHRQSLEQGSSLIEDIHHHHDLADNLKGIDDQLDNDFDFELDYDTRNRLRRVYAPVLKGSWFYTFNSQNLVDLVEAPPGVGPDKELFYDAGGNLDRITRGTSTTSYASDDLGNRKTAGASQFAYDPLNRLEQVTTASGTTATVYAHDGRRVERGDRIHLYGLGRLPLAELQLDASGKVTDARYNVHLGETLAQVVDGATGNTWHYANNHQQAPSVVFTPGGGIEQRAYHPFGEEIARGSSSPASLATDLSFQNNYRDPDTGFVVMHHREYDPESHAFLTLDPAGLRGGIGRHSFVNGNPATYTDRLGLDPDNTPSETIEVIGYLPETTANIFNSSFNILTYLDPTGGDPSGWASRHCDQYWVCDNILRPPTQFVHGGVVQFTSNNLAGYLDEELDDYDSDAFQWGRNVGDVASVGQAAYEVVQGVQLIQGAVVGGAAGEIGSGGTATAVVVPAAVVTATAGATMTAHGIGLGGYMVFNGKSLRRRPKGWNNDGPVLKSGDDAADAAPAPPPDSGSAPSAGPPPAGPPGEAPLAIFDYDLAAKQKKLVFETPKGNKLTYHGAERAQYPPYYRIVMPHSMIDKILETGQIRKLEVKKGNLSIAIQRRDMAGKPQVVVNDSGYVVTTIWTWRDLAKDLLRRPASGNNEWTIRIVAEEPPELMKRLNKKK